MFKQPWDQEYTSTDCLDNHQKTTHQDTRLIEAYRVERANRKKAETRIKSLEQEVELIRRRLEQFKCGICSKVFSRHYDMLRHKRVIHRNDGYDTQMLYKEVRRPSKDTRTRPFVQPPDNTIQNGSLKPCTTHYEHVTSGCTKYCFAQQLSGYREI